MHSKNKDNQNSQTLKVVNAAHRQNKIFALYFYFNTKTNFKLKMKWNNFLFNGKNGNESRIIHKNEVH